MDYLFTILKGLVLAAVILYVAFYSVLAAVILFIFAWFVWLR